MKKYLLTVLSGLILSGCVSHIQKPEILELSKEGESRHLNGEMKPPQPKIQEFDWINTLHPLVNQILKIKGITEGDSLLLDSINNNTSGILQTEKATSVLYKEFESSTTFHVVPQSRLIDAKKILGLSLEDSFSSLSKSIGLARIVNSEYVLYSDLIGDVRSPNLDMQLILVQTGEIIWSGNEAVTLVT